MHCYGASCKSSASKAIIQTRSPRYFSFPAFALKETVFKKTDIFLHSFGLKYQKKACFKGFEPFFLDWHVV